MLDAILLLTVVGGVVVGSLAFVRWIETDSAERVAVVFELRFPRDLDPDDVVTFITSLSGLLRPSWQRRLGYSPAVAFEILASSGRVRFFLVVPAGARAFVHAQLAATLPGVAAVEELDHRIERPNLAAELALTSRRRPLVSDHPENISRALLASYQPLGRGESISVSWIVTPHPPVGPIKPPSRSGTNGFTLKGGTTVQLQDSEAVRAARAKQASPLFAAVGRVGVTAPRRLQQLALMRRVLGALHITNAPGVHFRSRRIPSALVAGRVATRSIPTVEYPCILNAKELTALVAWPFGERVPAGVTVLGRTFPPAAEIPAKGRLVAMGNYPGQERPLALSVTDSMVHSWLCGPTGVGKSTLLGNLIAGDLAAGRGVVLLDPKGDLAADVLDRVPADRVHDVVYLDPSDDSRPVGMNVLAGAHRNPELMADQVLSILHHLWKDYWGPRSSDILHSSLLTLARVPGTTLVDLPLLLTNDGFRRQLVTGLDDFVLEQFWASYEAMSPGERGQYIAAPMNKLRQLLLRPRLRAVLGQAEPTFTIEDIISGSKILIVSLPVGAVGDEAAALVGSLVTARLWQAIQGRAAVAPDRRRPVMVFLDEFQRFVHSATDLRETLAQARGLKAGFHLAHQHVGQLPGELRQAVSANCRTKIIFQTAAADAPALARELGGLVVPEDLATLPAYEIITTLAARGQVTPPASGRTLPLVPTTGQAAAVRAASSHRYGRDRGEVDAAIRARQQGPLPAGPTLRKKRGQS